MWQNLMIRLQLLFVAAFPSLAIKVPQIAQMKGKHDLNLGLLGLIQLLIIIALVDGGRKNSHRNELFFVPIACTCIYVVFFCASDNACSDYIVAMNVATWLLTASDYILLRKHQPEFRQIAQKKPTSELSFIEQVKWAMNLVFASRGVGWVHEATSHLPPKPTTSRARFLASQLLCTASQFFLLNVVQTLARANPCFQKGGPSLTEYGWVWRTTSWLYVGMAYGALSTSYNALSIVAVIIGLSEPKDWPPLFGSLRDAYTLRNCWGRVWHQLLRKLLTSHSNFLVKTLHLPNSTFTTYFKLFTSFFISGLIHYAGDCMLLRNWSGTSIRFFVLQAVGISFEGTVITLFRRLGWTMSGSSVKYAGFCWVFAWFMFVLPIWVDPTVHASGMDLEMIASFVMWLWKGYVH